MPAPLLTNIDEEVIEFPLHGGDKSFASKIANIDEDKILDFSASINPLGPPKSVLEEVLNIGSQLEHYPDSQSSELKNQLERKFDVDTSGIVVTNGSMELIFLLPNLFKKGDDVLIVSPCFSEYQRALKLAKIATKNLVVSNQNDFNISVNNIVSELEKDGS